MTNNAYIDNEAPRLPGVVQDAAAHRNKAIPSSIARYLEHSAQVFLGISSVLGLVEASTLRDCDDEPQTAVLNPSDVSNLLGLANTSAALMAAEAESVAAWANKYLDTGAAPKMRGHG